MLRFFVYLQISYLKQVINTFEVFNYSKNNMWKLYALLSAIFAALTAILAKIGIKDIPSNVATAVRTVVIIFIAWGIILFTGEIKELKHLSKTNWIFLALSGVATGLSWVFYYKALALGPVSKVQGIDKLSVAIAMALAFVILKEPMDVKTFAGGLLIVAGSMLLIS
jgi:transporter family protein